MVSGQIDLATVLGAAEGIIAIAEFVERSSAFAYPGEPLQADGEQDRANSPKSYHQTTVGEVGHPKIEDER